MEKSLKVLQNEITNFLFPIFFKKKGVFKFYSIKFYLMLNP